MDEIKIQAQNILSEMDKFDEWFYHLYLNEECKTVDEIWEMVRKFLNDIVKNGKN